MPTNKAKVLVKTVMLIKYVVKFVLSDTWPLPGPSNPPPPLKPKNCVKYCKSDPCYKIS